MNAVQIYPTKLPNLLPIPFKIITKVQNIPIEK